MAVLELYIQTLMPVVVGPVLSQVQDPWNECLGYWSSTEGI